MESVENKSMKEKEKIAPELRLDWDALAERLINFLRDETKKAGLSKGVIGISGGIDSALSAALIVKALGKENVLGLYMPYKTSSASSHEHAKELAGWLGLELRVEPITDQVDLYFERHPEADHIRRGNKMARERMTILYDHSSAVKGLVIGTSNLTEILLGYGTLFGDTACALNPLGRLYKSQVWCLAEHLGVPESIIQKPPTADLWQGQTDEEELGVRYRDADKLLYHMDRLGEDNEELHNLGFDRELITRVRELIEKNRFKRNPTKVADISSLMPQAQTGR